MIKRTHNDDPDEGWETTDQNSITEDMPNIESGLSSAWLFEAQKKGKRAPLRLELKGRLINIG